jgi:hypothetical protein
MCVGTKPFARPPTCDPAIDVAKVTGEQLSRYERERSDEARAAIPLLPDTVPVLFEVQPLSAAALRWVKETTGEAMAHRAFLACCHAYTDERGAEHVAKVDASGRIAMAGDEWLDKVFTAYGGDVVAEVARVAIDRAEAGPRALAPFALPRGLMLPR